ncbi:TPA: hypothetical protein ACSKM3_002975, partial [Listeria monocytogenes]
WFFSNTNYYRNMGLVKRTSIKIKTRLTIGDIWLFIKNIEKEMEFNPKINRNGIKSLHQILNSDCLEI